MHQAALEAEEAEPVQRTLTAGQHDELVKSCGGVDSNLYVTLLPAISIGLLTSFWCGRIGHLKHTDVRGVDSNLYVTLLPAISIGLLTSFWCGRIGHLKHTDVRQLQYAKAV